MPAFEQKPKVTVVMVAYNHAKYLQEVMAGVFAQSLEDLEIILVDNGSQDGSQEIIKQFKDKRLKTIFQENQGLSLAYNLGIELSNGQYIALGNADDLWMPDKLEKQLKAIETQKAAAVFTDAELIDDSGQAVTVSDKLFDCSPLSRPQIYQKLFFKSNFFCAPSALLDAKILRQYKEPFHPCLIQLQDFELWIRLVKKHELLVLSEKLVKYRVRTDGHNLSLDVRNRSRVLFELAVVYKDFFKAVDPDFFNEAFGPCLKQPARDEISLQFESAFLFLKMGEPSVHCLGLELLYELMAYSENRTYALKSYGLKVTDLWELSKALIYTDSRAMEETLLQAGETAERLKASQIELSEIRRTMSAITSSRFWKLREKIYSMIKRS